jgi:hypothetical protein
MTRLLTPISMWYHALILDIFRPFLKLRQDGVRMRLRTFSASDSSPEAAFTASVYQLKDLVVAYRSQHSTAVYSITWQSGLLSLANAMLSNTAASDPEWTKYFRVCIYGYEALHHRFRVAEAIAQGLLTMAMRKGRVSSAEARALMDLFGDSGQHTRRLTGEDDVIHAGFTGDFELDMEDSDAASVEALADQFDGYALFQEFTNDVAGT